MEFRISFRFSELRCVSLYLTLEFEAIEHIQHTISLASEGITALHAEVQFLLESRVMDPRKMFPKSVQPEMVFESCVSTPHLSAVEVRFLDERRF